MITILNRHTTKYHARCKCCDAHIAFHIEDIKYEEVGNDWLRNIATFVECPVCGAKIYPPNGGNGKDAEAKKSLYDVYYE